MLSAPLNLKPAVFLDRDGVIIEEVNYLSQPSQLVLIPGAAEAISLLNRAGIPVIVITNQAGIARGFFPESRVAEIHGALDDLLGEVGAHIDAYYYCPHHPTEGFHPYRVECDCRKPRPGMLLAAASRHNLDLHRSIMIGDKLSDLEAGGNAGCQTILVNTGYGNSYASGDLDDPSFRLVYRAHDLLDAVQFCLPMLSAN